VPILWRRIAGFTSFALAVLLAVSMRNLNYGWLATLAAAITVWIIFPFIISQVCAAFILGGVHRRMRRSDGLAERIAAAVEGRPPDQQEAISKRMIDESLR
jgi:uncharacterized SAM-binding protein YcdF (DUF218 family)